MQKKCFCRPGSLLIQTAESGIQAEFTQQFLQSRPALKPGRPFRPTRVQICLNIVKPKQLKGDTQRPESPQQDFIPDFSLKSLRKHTWDQTDFKSIKFSRPPLMAPARSYSGRTTPKQDFEFFKSRKNDYWDESTGISGSRCLDLKQTIHKLIEVEKLGLQEQFSNQLGYTAEESLELSEISGQEISMEESLSLRLQDVIQMSVKPLKARIPIIPIANRVVFPGEMVRLNIQNYRQCKLYTVSRGMRIKVFGLVTTKNPQKQVYYNYGTLVGITNQQLFMRGSDLLGNFLENQMPRMTRNDSNLTVIALERFKILSFSDDYNLMTASIEIVQDKQSSLNEKLAIELRAATIKLLKQMQKTQTAHRMEQESDITKVGFIAASLLEISIPIKQGLLQNFSLQNRSELIMKHLVQTIENQSFSEQFQNKMREQMGVKPPQQSSKKLAASQQLQKKLKELPIPAQSKEYVIEELNRLKSLTPTNHQYNVVRTYLQTVAGLPWGVTSTDNYNIQQATQQLDTDHFGLQKIKTRIIQYLAVRSLRKDMKGSILCFNGPPGVGKTSLGQSIANAMNRKFYRVSLGGVRDQAEIRGHRKTYIGAMPGVFISALRKIGTSNPVILLDEIDKVGKDMVRGDPASALLEVLDPAQNHSFTDHYLSIPFDLSNVLFIATSNNIQTIPAPLYDRMEVIELSGYTNYQKLNIAQQFLIPKQIEANGLNSDIIEIQDDTTEAVIDSYTKQAGVRQLERTIGAVCRFVAVNYLKALNTQQNFQKKVVRPEQLEEILGVPIYENDLADRVSSPGVALGLAWTMVGGKVLLVESSLSPGFGHLRITGQLGDVMKESVLTALSWIKCSLHHILPIGSNEQNAEGIRGIDLHIHFPAAATPKDGPSAGITITSALVSLLTQVKLRNDTAMTGQISLKGNVLPVGGIKEKVIGAHRAGISRVILPMKNNKDLADIPEYVKKDIQFFRVSKIEEVLAYALSDPSVIVPVSIEPKL